MEIFVRPDGSVNHIYADGFSTAFLGEQIVRRASYVEPFNPALRFWFHLLRCLVSDKSLIAKWTRRWPCLWQANLFLSGGPVIGPFSNREDAIWAEIQWINQQYERGKR